MGISQMQGVQLPMEFVLGDRYHPVDFDLPHRSWSLDGVDHIPELMALGRQSAEAHSSRIQEQFLVGPAIDYVPYLEIANGPGGLMIIRPVSDSRSGEQTEVDFESVKS